MFFSCTCGETALIECGTAYIKVSVGIPLDDDGKVFDKGIGGRVISTSKLIDQPMYEVDPRYKCSNCGKRYRIDRVTGEVK